jgi:hypothetical protein
VKVEGRPLAGSAVGGIIAERIKITAYARVDISTLRRWLINSIFIAKPLADRGIEDAAIHPPTRFQTLSSAYASMSKIMAEGEPVEPNGHDVQIAYTPNSSLYFDLTSIFAQRRV